MLTLKSNRKPPPTPPFKGGETPTLFKGRLGGVLRQHITNKTLP